MALRVIAAAVAALMALHAVLLFGLLGVNEIPWLAAGLFVVCLLPRPQNSLLLSGSVLGAALALAFLVSATGIDEPLYFKPTTRLLDYDFSHGYQIFEPNSSVEMTEPFGALKAKTTQDVQSQEKFVRFVTDSRGFRNDGDYSGEPYLLVGDSFVVSTSVTQEQMLSRQLAEIGVRGYNVAAVGGDLTDYVRWMQDFYDETAGDPEVLLFFFEGNDFFRVEAGAPRPGFLERYRDLFRFMPLGKYAFTQFNRFKKKTDEDTVETRLVGGRQMLFYDRYIEVCRRKNYDGGPDFTELLSRIAEKTRMVYFIPAKYRIYAPLAENGAEADLPNAQWEYLSAECAGLGLTCVDLTPAVAARAGRLLPQGRFTYYLDDTHWNAEGIAAAAEEVRASLERSAGNQPERGN